MSSSATVDLMLTCCDELKQYIGILEEERDNYELLLRYLGAYDDSVEVHKFEDVVDKVQAYGVNCETVDVTSVTKDKIELRFNLSNGTSKTFSVPLPAPTVV